MTDFVGHIGAQQIERARTKLSDAVRDALWNRDLSHGREDPYIVFRDRDTLLEAAEELLFVIDEHIQPSHGDGLVRWS